MRAKRLHRLCIAMILWFAPACQTPVIEPESRRALHLRDAEFALRSLQNREARSADNLWTTGRKLESLLAGHPQAAQTALERMLELD